MYYINYNNLLLKLVGIHFVSPWYGHKTSSIVYLILSRYLIYIALFKSEAVYMTIPMGLCTDYSSSLLPPLHHISSFTSPSGVCCCIMPINNHWTWLLHTMADTPAGHSVSTSSNSNLRKLSCGTEKEHNTDRMNEPAQWWNSPQWGTADWN